MSKIQIQPHSSVLVLNSSYTPLHITSWKRAIILILKEKAQFVSATVIRLFNYVRIPISKMTLRKPTKSMIYLRDGYKCCYCSKTKNLTLDHIIPQSRGGEFSWNNICVACSECNTKKADRPLEQTGMKLLKTPRAPHNPVFLYLKNHKNPEWSAYTFE